MENHRKDDQTSYSDSKKDTDPKITEANTHAKITEEDAHDELMEPPNILRFISEDINLEGLFDGPPPVLQVVSGPINLKGFLDTDPHHVKLNTPP